ncbi:RNA 2',3'-cyclic phosphodiesterase [Motiliproteus sp. MSK22-1]|uniref:RNA 2',3'-cyclic phosphodiesterase n=1 Tax=Motiliproteus sp. MSK22-1 TaxID=1897630 RepID=UPI00097547F8|nr:RNA 2',3'-cyclic phosphodiesterase [Motiliproteus sp. MSK22-1]OMH30336.1 2'-5' RNA ligase [Motiliproteus sp. MSK22-1]
MDIRAFFALPLKQNVVRRLADHADTLCHLDTDGAVDWVDSDSYHLTLCFLGNIKLKQINSLETLVSKALRNTDSFQLHLDRGEYYRVSDELALLAALAVADSRLIALRRLLVDVIGAVGLNTEQQNFKPHVTLGRMNGALGFREPEIWPDLNLLNLADEVVLYQSKAGTNGSIYTPLFKVPLGIKVEA